MMIYEVGDYCCAILAPDGALIAQNMGGVSHFVADLGVIISDGVERFGPDGFAPGDVILTNHQRVAGQHLNNVVIYTPIFHERRLIGFAAIRAHWVDVGGMSTGFGASGLAFDPWGEGLQLDQLKACEAGVPDEKVLKLIADNIRFPDSSMGDLRSQVAACRLAERRLAELYERYGATVVEDAITAIFEQTEQRCRRAVAAIPDGVYEAESHLDGDPSEPEPIRVKVKVTISRRRDGDRPHRVLAAAPHRRQRPHAGRRARRLQGAHRAARRRQRGLVRRRARRDPRRQRDDGVASRRRWRAGARSCRPSSTPCSARSPTGSPTASPPGTSACSASRSCSSAPTTARRFVSQSIEGGGWGGRPFGDGESASVSICQGDVRNSPIENMELKVPLLVEERALVPDSGGAGLHRGGLGVSVRLRSLAEGRWNLRQSRRRSLPAWGLEGGSDGGGSDNLIRRPGEDEFSSVDAAHVQAPAQTVVIQTSAGGGGWGSPLERDPERVLDDVREGYVSARAATDEYGVVLTGDGTQVDAAATAALRSSRRRV